jgi:hypothetical protein
MDITKRIAKRKLGIKSDYAFAKYFECTRMAVSLWGEDEPLPKLRQMLLRARHPDKFPERKK